MRSTGGGTLLNERSHLLKAIDSFLSILQLKMLHQLLVSGLALCLIESGVTLLDVGHIQGQLFDHVIVHRIFLEKQHAL